MEVKILVEKQVKLTSIRVSAGVRYWHDCEYSEDGGKTWIEAEDDTDELNEEFKKHIPSIYKQDLGYGVGDYWDFTIDIDTGKINNWPKNFCLKTHFKVCDDGLYQIIDEDHNVVWDSIKNQTYYVPGFLSLEDSGWGDYIFININQEGFIEHWDVAKNRILELFE